MTTSDRCSVSLSQTNSPFLVYRNKPQNLRKIEFKWKEHFQEQPWTSLNLPILTFYQRYCRYIRMHWKWCTIYWFCLCFWLLLSQCTRHLCHWTRNVATCQFSITSINILPPTSFLLKQHKLFSFSLKGKESGKIKLFNSLFVTPVGLNTGMLLVSPTISQLCWNNFLVRA